MGAREKLGVHRDEPVLRGCCIDRIDYIRESQQLRGGRGLLPMISSDRQRCSWFDVMILSLLLRIVGILGSCRSLKTDQHRFTGWTAISQIRHRIAC
jgi:hypothetical protein